MHKFIEDFSSLIGVVHLMITK